jgi:hypothetical protein
LPQSTYFFEIQDKISADSGTYHNPDKTIDSLNTEAKNINIYKADGKIAVI